LSHRVDAVARNIIDSNADSPTLAYSNQKILSHLKKNVSTGLGRTFSRIASSLS